jgi:hypothetical protein
MWAWDYKAMTISTTVLAVIVLVIVVIYSTTMSPPINASSHHHNHKCLPPYTVLWVYTQPVQKECVLLIHNGHTYNANGTIMK